MSGGIPREGERTYPEGEKVQVIGYDKEGVIMGEFTHFNEQGHAVMVDVSEKADTMREATAMGRIRMSKECFEKVKTGGMKKREMSWELQGLQGSWGRREHQS